MSSAHAKSQSRQLRSKIWTKSKAPELPCQFIEEHIDHLRAFVKLHKSKRASPKMPAGKIRIFADCAGLSSEMIALSLLGFTSEQMEFVGGSEINSAKRSMMQAVHKTFGLKTEKKFVEQDIFDRALPETKASDLYIAGFPCPAYSSCGRKLGAKDGQKRGLLIFEGLKYIAYWKPSLVVFENVSAFLNKRHARTHKVMKKCFAALNYKVYVKKVSTKEHGIPQSRSRCYLVACRCDKKQKVSFKFPKPLKCPRLLSFLDTHVEGTEKLTLPTYESKYGSQIWQEDLVLDVGCSAGWQSKLSDLCPCLIRTRCLSKGYYLPKQLRRLTSIECARLQGLPDRLVESIQGFLVKKGKCADLEAAEKQVMGALGDSMSINVLMRILVRALPAAGLWPSSLKSSDPWSSASTNELGRLANKLYSRIHR